MDSARAKQAKVSLEKQMTAQGIPLRFLSFLLPKMALETAGFTSRVSKVNNLSGIKFNRSGYCYDSGIKPPSNEGATSYAGYNTLDLWAKDYLRIVKRNGLLDSKNHEDFLIRMKDKGYFTATLEEYKKAFYSWTPQLSKLFTGMKWGSSPATSGAVVIIVIGILFLTFLNK